MNHLPLVTQCVEGTIVAYATADLLKGVLVTGADCARIVESLLADGARLIGQGALTLRLGVALYDRPFVFVPHSVIDEAGRQFRGEVIFDWLRLAGYEMPRSEVFGLDARGREDQVFARDIDIESSPIVVGGPDEAAVFIARRIGEAALPPRFAQALVRLESAEPPAVRAAVELS